MSKNIAQVIFEVEKLKTINAIKGSLAHQTRRQDTPNANPKKTNIVLVEPPSADKIMDHIVQKLGGNKPPKNAVLASDIFISVSPIYFRPDHPERAGYWDEVRLMRWRKAIEPWIKERFPDAISVILHLDEATPHYAVTDLPINKSTGNLSHRAKFGGNCRSGADSIGRWQDLALEPVEHLGIERGVRGSKATHEAVTKFYGDLAAPIEPAPQVTTQPPVPLPEPTFAERVPFSEAKAEREHKEYLHIQQGLKRDAEISKLAEFKAKQYEQLLAKAKRFEAATRRADEMTATALKAQQKADTFKSQADRLRPLPLPDVIRRIYGGVEAKDTKAVNDSRKFELQDGRQVIVVGEEWLQQGGRKGKGAIPLVMHLDSFDKHQALRLLAEHFDYSSLVATNLSRLADTAETQVTASQELQVPAPVPDPNGWPRVRAWLNTARGIPAKLIDILHASGRLYSDSQGNLIFPRSNGGAFQFGTGDIPFRRSIGRETCGPFTIDCDSTAIYAKPLSGHIAPDAWVCWTPIEAIAIKAVHPNAYVVAAGNSFDVAAELKPWLQDSERIYAGFAVGSTEEKLVMRLRAAFGERVIRHEAMPPHKAGNWADAIKEWPSLVAEDWRQEGERQSEMAVPVRPRTNINRPAR